MLQAWREALGLNIILTDATVERTDGIDLDARLRRAMRAWYLDALDHGPLCHLSTEDVAREATEMLTHGRIASSLEIPEAWRRIVSVQLSGWERPAAPVAAADAPLQLERMASLYSAPGPAEPVAVIVGSTLICCPAAPRALCVLAAVDPGPELYRMSESLLGTIPTDPSPIIYEYQGY